MPMSWANYHQHGGVFWDFRDIKAISLLIQLDNTYIWHLLQQSGFGNTVYVFDLTCLQTTS